MKKDPSIYEFLKVKVSFTSEPLWFRLVVIALALGFYIALIWALQKWALPTLVLNKLTGIKWLDVLKFGKGRSP